MHHTRLAFFWPSNRHRDWSNPARRWWPHKQFFRAIGLTGAVITGSYLSARWQSADEPAFGNAFVQWFVSWAPNPIISSVAGDLASTDLLPAALHRACIFLLDPTADVSKYRTLQEYYTRPFPEERDKALADATAVIPCDGKVLSLTKISGLKRGVAVQVKGHEYPINELFRHIFDEETEENDRFVAVIQLEANDIHHVRSPVEFQISHTMQIPGNLLPVSVTAAKWIPLLYTSNERVSIIGCRYGTEDVYAVCLVGGLCEGKIKIDFDQRVATNVDQCLVTTVKRSYTNFVRHKGAGLGRFEMGSAVVMVFDVARDSKVRLTPGARCRMGEALYGYDNPTE